MKQTTEKNPSQKKFSLKTLLWFAAEFAVLWLMFHYWFFLAAVPTSSMEPNIPKSSLSIVTYPYGEKQVERGDCVVFWSDELGERLVKRVVGLPGEEIVIDEAGEVYVDGERLEEEYVQFQYGVDRTFSVPEGCYLFFGDNRANSNDARWWEEPYISGEKLVGKVQIVLWPLSAFAFVG